MLTDMALARQKVECPARPLTRRDYEDLVNRGVLEEAKVELLDGRIASMSPHGDPHRIAVRRLARLLIRSLGDRAAVDVQSSYAASELSKPEPDVVVLPPGDEPDAVPKRAWLVVEVADSSLLRDRGVKARLYAAAGVPEYWIVNLLEDVIEVHRQPGPDAYGQVTRHLRGEVLMVPSFEDIAVSIDDVLPPRR
jgi:Uma2 family endonuclease